MDGRKHSVIEADGRIYNLRVSYNALAMFEENVGPVQMIAGKDAKTFIGFRGLVWAAINSCGGNITVLEAGDICEAYSRENGIVAFHAKMQEIIDTSGWMNPETGDDAKNRPEKPKKQSEK